MTAVPASLAYELMTEKELGRHIRKLARDLGLLAYHTADSRGSSAGYPDWTIAGPGGVLFAELKSARGTLRPEQVEWRDRLLDAGARWHLWRPAHLASGEIARTLTMISTYREK
jgi:hypothetical protein